MKKSPSGIFRYLIIAIRLLKKVSFSLPFFNQRQTFPHDARMNCVERGERASGMEEEHT